MCLNPVSCPTTTKYVSLKYRDHFVNQFPCGRCSECQRLLSLQSSFRANYEFDDLPDQGYVLFDCLTYRNKDVPHLSDFWTLLPKSLDFMCFNRKHIRNFLQTFRQRLIRAGYGKNSVRYFYACEYGTEKNKTHRPHIHLMLYVHNPDIDPIWLSSLVADVWKFGRTDGYPYKTKRYVFSHNLVPKNNLASRLRTISYITKYLQKKAVFQLVLDKRIAVVMPMLAKFANPDAPDKWLESELARRERLKLLRFVNQFHSNSQQFGASALSDFDFDELCKSGCVIMPSNTAVKIKVPLSTYYKRKMFYELVQVDGCRYWQLNDLGKEFQQKRKGKLLFDLSKRFEASFLNSGIVGVDPLELSKYVLDERGTISVSGVSNCSSSVLDRFENLSFYNYSSSTDKLNFGCRGLSSFWLGSPQVGYLSSKIPDRVSLPYFISHYVYFNPDFENVLNKLYFSKSAVVIRDGKQEAHCLRQHLLDLYSMVLKS